MKKISIAFCLFLISFTLQAQSLGDVDENGRSDIVDALLIAQYYVGYSVNNFNSNLADVNFDESLDVVDTLLIAQ